MMPNLQESRRKSHPELKAPIPDSPMESKEHDNVPAEWGIQCITKILNGKC